MESSADDPALEGSGLDDDQDAAAWRNAAALHAFNVTISSGAEGFVGHTVSRAFGNYAVVSLKYSDHSGRRSPEEIDPRAPRRWLVCLVLKGSTSLTQDDRTGTARQGQILFLDTARPAEYEMAAGEEIDFVLPPSELELPEAVLRSVTARPFNADHGGAAGALAAVMQTLATVERPGGPPRRESSWVLARAAVHLARATLLEHAEQSGELDPHREPRLIDAIDAYIDQHLADPELTPPKIAAEHFISIRHLHALFESRETTVAVLIRVKRLERCVDLLVDPANASTPVVAIARRMGFTNMSHFASMFRQYTGLTPTQYRSTHTAYGGSEESQRPDPGSDRGPFPPALT